MTDSRLQAIETQALQWRTEAQRQAAFLPPKTFMVEGSQASAMLLELSEYAVTLRRENRKLAEQVEELRDRDD